MIYIILGTKAQLIKMAPIMVECLKRNVPYRFISTGQHRETFVEILENFGIRAPDDTLYVGPDIVRIPQMVRWFLAVLWAAYRRRHQLFPSQNGVVLVHGDTLSTVVGAFVGKLMGLKVGHVESGLRSFKLFEPFPEELSRLLTFALSDVYFCQDAQAVSNLRGYRGKKFNLGANTLLDAIRFYLHGRSGSVPNFIPRSPFAVVTVHRFENFKDVIASQRVLEAVRQVSETIPVVFVLHQFTRDRLVKFGQLEQLKELKNIDLRNRFAYFPFIELIQSAEFVVSDGGSNQEECSYLGIPVLLLRQVSERQEGLGQNAVLSGFDPVVIDKFLRSYADRRGAGVSPDAQPSKVVIDVCLEELAADELQ